MLNATRLPAKKLALAYRRLITWGVAQFEKTQRPYEYEVLTRCTSLGRTSVSKPDKFAQKARLAEAPPAAHSALPVFSPFAACSNLPDRPPTADKDLAAVIVAVIQAAFVPP